MEAAGSSIPRATDTARQRREYDREVEQRQTYAECTDCPWASRSGWAIAAGVDHAISTGHVVRGDYRAVYLYRRAEPGGSFS